MKQYQHKGPDKIESMGVFKIGAGGMVQIDVPENHKKNNLPIGTILQLEGYSCSRYVIVKNRGISENFASHGAMYATVNLNDHSFMMQEAMTMDHISTKKDSRIHMYFTDEVMPPDEVLEIWQKSRKLEQEKEAAAHKAVAAGKVQEDKGRALFAQHIPATAQALIVARYVVDDCDHQTDYFDVKTREYVILGWSKHTRDIFSEMRKHVSKLPETAHLAAPNPKHEHREKYSMGHGFYLKSSGRYSTGWEVSKVKKYGDNWDAKSYRSLAARCVL